MLSRHKQLLSSFERVQDFLKSNPLPTPPVKYTERVAELDATVKRLGVLLTDQSAGQRGSRDDTVRQVATRKLLRGRYLAPLSRIAKVVLPEDKTIQKAFAMPRANLATQQLIAVAKGFRDSALPYEGLFVENGRPADFLAQLDTAIESLRGTILGRARNIGRHVGAKEGLTQTLGAGRRCVQMLDAMVLDGFAGNAELIAKWRIAKRVQDVPGGGIRATGGTADENVAPAPELPKAA
jgi:hypothetical protein